MRTRAATAVAAGLLAAGCTLADVVVPESEDVLVVEGVLRTDLPRQAILLHRSVRGGASAEEPGATVVVRRPGALVPLIVLSEEPPGGQGCFVVDPLYRGGEDPLEVRGTCYLSPAADGYWVAPGATYELEVVTTRGERARGRTTVPGEFSLKGVPFSRALPFQPQACAVPAGTPYPLRWTPAPGAWGYIAPVQIFGLSIVLPAELPVADPLELLGLAISARDTSIVLPTEFGVFERFRLDQEILRILQQGLPGGTMARVSVAAADRNYINGVRGGSFNPSGQVRISSVSGDAVGVFASLQPLVAIVAADEPQGGRPPCGTS